MLCLVRFKKKEKKKKFKNATKHILPEKRSNWNPCACWSLVSVAHSLCLGRDSGGLKDFAGRVWRCTFRWWEQTAAFLFCHLTFWWGDVSPVARLGRGVKGGQLQWEHAWVCGTFSGVHTNLGTANWARPLPAVSARTVTSQSYSVYPIITAAFPSSVHCNTGYCFETLPVHGTVSTFCFCLFYVLL